MRLKDIREDYDLKQVEVAKILHITQANYSRWETGSQLIPLSKLNDFCVFFDVSMDYAIGVSKKNFGYKNVCLNSKVIGNRLKNFRKANGLSQIELANLLNTSQSTISAYESGKTFLLTAFAIELVKRYRISLDWLCGSSDNITVLVES